MSCASSLLAPMIQSWLCSEMLGTAWLGMARMMICRTGEIGEMKRLMPMMRKAVAIVMAAVTWEVE